MSDSDFDTDRLFDPELLKLDDSSQELSSEFEELEFEVPVNSLLERPTVLESIQKEIADKPENQPGYDFKELEFEEYVRDKNFDLIQTAPTIKIDYPKYDDKEFKLPVAEPTFLEQAMAKPKLSGIAASALIAAGYAATAFASMFGSIKKSDVTHLEKTAIQPTAVIAPQIPGDTSNNGLDLDNGKPNDPLVIPSKELSSLDSEPTDISTLTIIKTSDEFKQYVQEILPNHNEALDELKLRIDDAAKKGNFSDLMGLKKDINNIPLLARLPSENRPLEMAQYYLRKCCTNAVYGLEYKILEANKSKYPSVKKSFYDKKTQEIEGGLLAHKHGEMTSLQLGKTVNSFFNKVLSNTFDIVPLSYSEGVITASKQLNETLLDTFRRNNEATLTEIYQSFKDTNSFYGGIKNFIDNSNLNQANKTKLNEKLHDIELKLKASENIFVNIAKRAWLKGDILGNQEAYVIHHHESFPSSGEVLNRDRRLQDEALYEINRDSDGFSYRELEDPTPSEVYRYIDKLDYELQELESAGLLEEGSKRALYIWNHGGTAKNGDHLISMKEEILPAGESNLYGYSKPNLSPKNQSLFEQKDVTNDLLSMNLVTNKINRLLEKHPKIEEFNIYVMTCRTNTNFIHNNVKKDDLHDNLNLVYFVQKDYEHMTQWVNKKGNYGISQGAMAKILYKLTQSSPESVDSFISANTETLLNILAIDKGLTQRLGSKNRNTNLNEKKYELQSGHTKTVLGFQDSRFAKLLPKLDKLVEEAHIELSKNNL